ncbi:MAG: DUF1549 domain-containing protein, partial [Acidobacteriota bacterium]|nr:DUF1549 domain-containing protein [Acidobacteriota bacterium]
MVRLVALTIFLTVAAGAQQPEERVRKIFADNCLGCHGSARMSGLSLNTREAMLAGGTRGPAVVPGKSSESLLYKAVMHEGGLAMPPKKSLGAEQVAAIREWIDAGAPFAAEQLWWSFRKPVRPAAKSIDELMRTTAAQADKRTLIRRATFDLTGLPPTPAEVEAFVSDPDPKAYEKTIERLLASPRYGERWGRMWLDVARYADTGGYETDLLFPNAWRYRDYVIRSFNDDKPYDTFIQEQVAADEIWPDNLDLDGIYELPEAKRKNLERRMGTTLYTL